MTTQKKIQYLEVNIVCEAQLAHIPTKKGAFTFNYNWKWAWSLSGFKIPTINKTFIHPMMKCI